MKDDKIITYAIERIKKTGEAIKKLPRSFLSGNTTGALEGPFALTDTEGTVEPSVETRHATSLPATHAVTAENKGIFAPLRKLLSRWRQPSGDGARRDGARPVSTAGADRPATAESNIETAVEVIPVERPAEAVKNKSSYTTASSGSNPIVPSENEGTASFAADKQIVTSSPASSAAPVGKQGIPVSNKKLLFPWQPPSDDGARRDVARRVSTTGSTGATTNPTAILDPQFGQVANPQPVTGAGTTPFSGAIPTLGITTQSSPPSESLSGQGYVGGTASGMPGGKPGIHALSSDDKEKQQAIADLFRYIASSSGPQDNSYIKEMIEKISAMEDNKTEGTPNENSYPANSFSDGTVSAPAAGNTFPESPADAGEYTQSAAASPVGSNGETAGDISITINDNGANDVQNYFSGSDNDPATDDNSKDENKVAEFLKAVLQDAVKVDQGN